MIKGMTILLLIIGVAGGIFLLQTRRDLPFQEIVEFDESIAIINARDWYRDKIDISISSVDNHKVDKLHYAKNGVCLYKKKQGDQTIKIKLERTDLKGRLLYKNKIVYLKPKKQSDKYIVLVGASVGSGWKFDRLSERIHLPSDIVLGFRPHYVFDKTKTINKLIALPVPVYSVIIKECSAYFPRDIDKSIQKVKQWVSRLQSHDIIPILATVVPVTEQRDKESPGKQESILKYNDSIRSFAIDHGLLLVDLEKSLRVNLDNRHLKNEYAQPDGVHLISPGYRVLDKMMENLFHERF